MIRVKMNAKNIASSNIIRKTNSGKTEFNWDYIFNVPSALKRRAVTSLEQTDIIMHYVANIIPVSKSTVYTQDYIKELESFKWFSPEVAMDKGIREIVNLIKDPEYDMEDRKGFVSYTLGKLNIMNYVDTSYQLEDIEDREKFSRAVDKVLREAMCTILFNAPNVNDWLKELGIVPSKFKDMTIVDDDTIEYTLTGIHIPISLTMALDFLLERNNYKYDFEILE